mgnify:CR=1 FL=1
MATGPVRNLIAALTCLAVLAMGLAAGAARGQVRVGGQVAVLCSGGGLVQVTLDAEGVPTGRQHICPDLALSLLAAFDLAPADVTRPAVAGEDLTPLSPRRSTVLTLRATQARAPPVSA